MVGECFTWNLHTWAFSLFTYFNGQNIFLLRALYSNGNKSATASPHYAKTKWLLLHLNWVCGVELQCLMTVVPNQTLGWAMSIGTHSKIVHLSKWNLLSYSSHLCTQMRFKLRMLGNLLRYHTGSFLLVCTELALACLKLILNHLWVYHLDCNAF